MNFGRAVRVAAVMWTFLLFVGCGEAVLSSAPQTRSQPLGVERPSVQFGGPKQLPAGAGTVNFVGSVSGLPAGTEGDYVVVVQGVRATLTPSAGGGTWGVWLPVGPTPPTGGFPAGFPYLPFYVEPNRAALPFLVELLHVPTGLVVDRDKTFLFDLRASPFANPRAPADDVERLGIQLTERGVDRLEATHLSSLPLPDLASFNTLLTEVYPAPAQSFESETGFSANDKVCMPLKDVKQLFKNTATFVTLKGIAAAQYSVFQALQAQGVPTTNLCVKTADIADVDHYELCVGRLDGTLVRAELSGVLDVDLAPTVGGLESTVVLGRVDQWVDVDLRDVSIRWKDSPTCLMRDALTLTLGDDELLADPERAAWAHCTRANAKALQAVSSPPLGLHLGESLSDKELFEILDDGQSSFEIPFPAQQTVGTGGTCAEVFVSSSVESLLTQYFPPLEAALGTAWQSGTPNGWYAKAGDSLLATLEHGTYDAPLDHTLQSKFKTFGAVELPNSAPVSGLYFKLETNAHLKPGYDVVPVPDTFFLEEAGDVEFSSDGLSPHQSPVAFDLAFSFTTGTLNQVLRELSATVRMNYTAPAPSAPTTLGQVLATVNPVALAPLASPTVEWRVAATRAPFTWMLGDPPTLQSPGIAYHSHDLKLDAVEPGVGGAPDHVLLRLRLDFLDPALNLGFSSTLGERFLIPTLSTPLFIVTVASSDLPGCPMIAHENGSAGSCDRGVELLASLALRPWALEMMKQLLSDYPAPQFFDAAGHASAPVQLRNLGSFAVDNRITLYGELPQ